MVLEPPKQHGSYARPLEPVFGKKTQKKRTRGTLGMSKKCKKNESLQKILTNRDKMHGFYSRDLKMDRNQW